METEAPFRDTDGVKQLYEYHAWSNRRVLSHLGTLPEGVAEQEVHSVFPTVMAVLRHLCQVDELWLDVMRGAPIERTMERMGHIRAVLAAADLGQLAGQFNDVSSRYRAFLAETDPDGLVVAVHPTGGRLETTVAELVRHVCNHGTYHRGNITAMLRQMGHAGVPTDYVLFLMERRPAEPPA